MGYRIKVPSRSAPPDEAQLLSGMERAWFALQRRKAEVGIAVLIMVVVTVVVGIVVWQDSRHAREAERLEAEATRLFLDRTEDQPKFSPEQLERAVALYRQVVEEYPHSPSAPIALFRLGNALVNQQDYDGAVAAYRNFTERYGDHPILFGLVQQRLGYAYLLKGDRDKAVEAFSTVLDIPGTLNKDQALFEVGKLEEAQGRHVEAMAHYVELKEKYQNSPYVGEAQMRIKALEAKTGI
ncbi:MAG: tetratricopeptide repeat protein, partial [Nitrospirales bacterium]